jgi:hypothetical protein
MHLLGLTRVMVVEMVELVSHAFLLPGVQREQAEQLGILVTVVMAIMDVVHQMQQQDLVVAAAVLAEVGTYVVHICMHHLGVVVLEY